MKKEELAAEAERAVEELIEVSGIRPGKVLVVGCSTSEIVGGKIGTCGSEEAAEAAAAVFGSIYKAAKAHGLYLAFQCCEHLNRALVTEREAMEKFGWEEVTVRPMPHAGGSMATAAYDNFTGPVVVEQIKADAGIDIGQTLIGMHLKRVAVPVRLAQNTIGAAIVTAGGHCNGSTHPSAPYRRRARPLPRKTLSFIILIMEGL